MGEGRDVPTAPSLHRPRGRISSSGSQDVAKVNQGMIRRAHISREIRWARGCSGRSAPTRPLRASHMGECNRALLHAVINCDNPDPAGFIEYEVAVNGLVQHNGVATAASEIPAEVLNSVSTMLQSEIELVTTPSAVDRIIAPSADDEIIPGFSIDQV